MKRQNQKDGTKQARKDRRIAIVTAALPLVVALASVFFLAAVYATHDCAGEGCFACAQIHRGFETWQRFWGDMAGVFSVVSSGVAMAFLFHLSIKFHPLEQKTPVSVKIRLND
jgi:hypothetical protein